MCHAGCGTVLLCWLGGMLSPARGRLPCAAKPGSPRFAQDLCKYHPGRQNSHDIWRFFQARVLDEGCPPTPLNKIAIGLLACRYWAIHCQLMRATFSRMIQDWATELRTNIRGCMHQLHGDLLIPMPVTASHHPQLPHHSPPHIRYQHHGFSCSEVLGWLMLTSGCESFVACLGSARTVLGQGLDSDWIVPHKDSEHG